jgi:RNA polymerase sigma-70 factor (ECF subfamily)
MNGVPGIDHQTLEQHISQIPTVWTMLMQAHGDSVNTAARAQRQLIERYTPAIYRFLLSLVRDWDVADDLFQEFALRFVRGAFKNLNPERSRFRDYLKTSLRNLVIDYHRGKRRPLQPLGEFEPAVQDPPSPEDNEEFVTIWREELLNRSLKALAAFEEQTGQQLYTVLRFRMDHPDMHSPEMAEQLAGKIGKAITPGWIRKRLHAAREKLGDLLLGEVLQSLPNPTEGELEQELIDVGLWHYCQAALERRRRRG